MVVLGLQNAGRDLNVDSFVAGMEKIKDFRGIFGYPPNELQVDQTPGVERVVPGRGEGRPLGAGAGRGSRLLIAVA